MTAAQISELVEELGGLSAVPGEATGAERWRMYASLPSLHFARLSRVSEGDLAIYDNELRPGKSVLDRRPPPDKL